MPPSAKSKLSGSTANLGFEAKRWLANPPFNGSDTALPQVVSEAKDKMASFVPADGVMSSNRSRECPAQRN